MSTGTIVQIIGAVVDVEFPRDTIPKIYDALKLEDRDLTLEVQQQLGDGVVRTIARGSSVLEPEEVPELVLNNRDVRIPVPIDVADSMSFQTFRILLLDEVSFEAA